MYYIHFLKDVCMYVWMYVCMYVLHTYPEGYDKALSPRPKNNRMLRLHIYPGLMIMDQVRTPITSRPFFSYYIDFFSLIGLILQGIWFRNLLLVRDQSGDQTEQTNHTNLRELLKQQNKQKKWTWGSSVDPKKLDSRIWMLFLHQLGKYWIQNICCPLEEKLDTFRASGMS